VAMLTPEDLLSVAAYVSSRPVPRAPKSERLITELRPRP
jgi:hypothetical protein